MKALITTLLISNLLLSCSKSNTTSPGNPPSIVLPTLGPTTAISSITLTSASSGGVVLSIGGAEVTARGVCWRLKEPDPTVLPTIADSKTVDAAGMGSFTSLITGVIRNTTYYVRAYATNSGGTSYGTLETFVSMAIGDLYKGGVIFYILQNGDPGYIQGVNHGFIVSPNDLGLIQWNSRNHYFGTTIPSALGTGKSNTDLIVSSINVNNGTFPAAKQCHDLSLNGFNDWYLPSKDELNKLFINRAVVGIPTIQGLSGVYFSSSVIFYSPYQEYMPNSQDFFNGSVYNEHQITAVNVRPIRSF